MSSSIRLRVLSLLPLFGVTVPLAATADELHSWCISGGAKDPDRSTEQQVKDVVGHVCNMPNFDYCCGRSPSRPGKWDMACVQQGSAYAFNTLHQDVCGRYAWVQGPVTGTQQYYPRDFNLIALGGDVTGLANDVTGPVASKGHTTAAYFSLSSTQREELALVAKGGVSFTNGTIWGNVLFDGNYSANGSISYPNGYQARWWHTSTNFPFPLDFAGAYQKLVAMSDALFRYPTTPGASAAKSNNTITFTGTDNELNVFEISGALLPSTTNYSFNVPPNSTIIVNVDGTTASIRNAGFTDANGHALSARNMLWNFSGTKTLTFQSVGFPGSILAPYAIADLKWGELFGTAVVWSAAVSQQLHFRRFELPGCSGCLCLDQDWSCSADTTLDDTGFSAVLEPEAGFLNIPGGQYTAESDPNRYAPDHRIWYSFRPADAVPKNKPLAVFFNGGPGYATTPILFSFNTGPVKMVDPTGDASSLTLVSNAHSWTQFANLLYIDAPATGFSYPLPHPGNSVNDVGTDIDEDAGIFLRIIVQFLHRHPALLHNRVILVGESYGGTRASLMLKYLYEYNTLTSQGGGAYQDDRLYADLMRYFPEAYGDQSPGPAQIKKTFGHLVLIDPALVGQLQVDNSANYTPSPELCVPDCWKGGNATCDPDNCNKPVINGVGWESWMLSLAAQNLTNLSTLNKMLGLNAATIEWMKVSARTQAFGRDQYGLHPNPPLLPPSADWLNAFGSASDLAPQDTYYLVENLRAEDEYGCLRDPRRMICTGTSARSWRSAGVDVGGAFVMAADRLWGTFITVTKYDAQYPAQAIVDALNSGLIANVLPCPQASGVPCGVGYDPNYPTSASLPGRMLIAYVPMGGFSGLMAQVSMPTAYNAGHSVTMQDGDRFESDVQNWFHATAFP